MPALPFLLVRRGVVLRPDPAHPFEQGGIEPGGGGADGHHLGILPGRGAHASQLLAHPDCDQPPGAGWERYHYAISRQTTIGWREKRDAAGMMN